MTETVATDEDVELEPTRDPTVLTRVAAVATAASAIVIIGYVVAVRTAWGQRLDNEAWLGRVAATPRATHIARLVLATVSVSSIAVSVIVLAIVAFSRGRPRLALVAGVAALGADATSEVLKHFVFTRPVLLAHAPITGNVYPSGHSTVAMSTAVAAILVAPHRWRGAVGIVGLAYATAVGGGTLVVGWHRPSDVVGGFAVAIAWGAAAAFFLTAWRGCRRAVPEPNAFGAPPMAGVLAAVGVGLVVVAVVVLVGTVGSGAHLFVLRRERAFAAAGVTIAAVAALFGSALLGALRGVTLDPPLRSRGVDTPSIWGSIDARPPGARQPR